MVAKPQTIRLDAARNLDTLARVAEVPTVASRTIESVGVTGITPAALLGQTTVSADPNSDILTFEVTNRNPALAVRLANEVRKTVHQLPDVATDGSDRQRAGGSVHTDQGAPADAARPIA